MFVQLSAGTSHTCGVKVDQTLACWGAFRGAPGGLYQQVSAGSAHTCALTEHGTVVCWGDNAFGKCRHPGGADFVQVAAGGTFSCALRRNGLAQCWGDDSLGQASPPEGVQFRQIDASPTGHACGVTVAAAAVTGKSGSKSGNGGGGDVVCWGRNFDGEAAPRAGPFRQVSCGAYSTCAISAVDDTAACWGATRTSSRGPFYELVIAHAHACGIGADGGLQCWGSASGAERVPDGFQVA
ncbi:regulator of chromosome condensation 1/beta-lactamase-inhibitor protein II [Tribonema minus]|uniref:non-specific serine/threonine protein kinase n=1 Tax=Tribonema minus TaxID=303371 RepID=A0A835Z3U7_9STRA|nr:regulator of chromosome condensation 1/beta-lactamase-inhibitor protein II [Tribonema minus]